MNAAQAGIQAQQNRTNLAEKARQFDISHKLAVTEQNLRERKFTLDLENADLDQQYRQEQITQAQALNEKNRKLLADQQQFAPSVRSYRNDLIQWNGMGEPPPVDPSLPTAIRDMLNVERSDAYEDASKNQNLIEQRNGFSYMVQNHSDKMGQDADGNLTYNRVQYLKLKGQDAKKKANEENAFKRFQMYLQSSYRNSRNSSGSDLDTLEQVLKMSKDSEGVLDLKLFRENARMANMSNKAINEYMFGYDQQLAFALKLAERKAGNNNEETPKEAKTKEDLLLEMKQTPEFKAKDAKYQKQLDESGVVDRVNKFDFRGL